jgi:hypothetical protein
VNTPVVELTQKLEKQRGVLAYYQKKVAELHAGTMPMAEGPALEAMQASTET